MTEKPDVSQAKNGPIKTLATEGIKRENNKTLRKGIGAVMFSRNRRAFTLVELLVVISIIGILAATVVSQMSKARDMARAMRCKANLKNLAQAALNYGIDNTRLPWAGSHEDVDSTRSGYMTVHLRRGWVDWTTAAGGVEVWPKGYSSGASYSGKGKMVTVAEGKAGCMSVTNGVLWSYMGRDLSTYVCEAHRSRYDSEKGTRTELYRSYFMNGYFGYNKDYYPVRYGHRDIWLNNLSSRGSAASLLMFAELAVKQAHGDEALALDGVIETKIVGYNDGKSTKNAPKHEIIGFNHTVGKRYVAHVAYADGHVDVLHTAEKGMTEKQESGLVYYLCNGYELPTEISEWKVP